MLYKEMRVIAIFAHNEARNIISCLPVRQLCKGHYPKLFGATQCANAFVAAVACDVAVEGRARQEIHQLGKQCLASVHGNTLQKISKGHFSPISNRHQAFLLGKPRQSWRSVVRVLI